MTQRTAFHAICIYLLRLRGDIYLAGLGSGQYRHPS